MLRSLHYGNSYTKIWVSTYGSASFVEPDEALGLDWPPSPRAGVSPFWDVLKMDANSSIWTGVIGSGLDQQFLVEWRNVRPAGGTSPVSFEAILSANGDITFNYADVSTGAGQGAGASIGIVSPGGRYGLQYSYQEPVLVSGAAVTFLNPEDPQPIAHGSLSGIVTAAGAPIPRAEVTTSYFRTAADSSGRYRFDDLEAGSYEVDGLSGCDAAVVNVDVAGDANADLPLTHFVNDFGLTCKAQPVNWISADTVLPEGSPPIDLPFPVVLRGETYTALQVELGTIYLCKPDGFSDGAMGFIVEDAWNLSSQSTVLFKAVGLAPNRHFAIEVRGIPLRTAPEVRLTWEAVFGEDGTVSFAFKETPDPARVTNGVFVGFEWDDGTLASYREDGRGLFAGNAIVFQPSLS